MNSKFSKTNLNNIVSQSKSKRECLIKLGMKPYGGNYRILDKYVSLYGIDESKCKLACLFEKCHDIMNKQDINSEIIKDMIKKISERAGI